MSILIFFYLILAFWGTDIFIKNATSYTIYKIHKIDKTHITFPKEGKLYTVRRKRRNNKFYLLRESVTNLFNYNKKGNVKDALKLCSIQTVKQILKTNLHYCNDIFNSCKLDRLLVTFNVFLHFLLNTVDKKKEKQILFSKGKILEIKDEKKCEKYKCNYKDISRNKNYKTFLTSIFIHKSIVHLYFNMSSLVSIYKLVSLMYTNTQIFTVFLMSGFISNVLSYLYDRRKEKYIYFDNIINQDSTGTKHLNTNKIICGSSSSIYSLYGLYTTYIIFFYFKNKYIINTLFLYNFFYSFFTSLFLENVSHVNHILGFLCGSMSAFFIILFNKN